MLRILSINIHKGFSWLHKRFVLHQFREAIQSTSADIVFLQEVVGENNIMAHRYPRWPSEPHYEFLADSMWSEHAYGKNAVYPHGHHGNAILSAYPIIHSQKIDISTNRFEQRGFLYCAIKVGNYPFPLHCICVHLGLFAKSRRKQVNILETYISEKIHNSDPLIIAGDFNEWRRQVHSAFCSSLGLEEVFLAIQKKTARTFPVWLPVLALDRIYLRGFNIINSKAYSKGIWSRLSDHGALFTEVNLDEENIRAVD
ncbi:MAG: endonuclease/exonuclease/phosphatase family protein [bacterium]